MIHHPIDILSGIATEITKRIVEALGKDTIKAAFVSGSVARGDVAWFDRGDKLEIYSDVDISVVLSNEADAEISKSRARAIAADVPLEGEHFEMVQPVGVGVYSLKDLLDQPARPGTVDVADSHLLLFGDAAIPIMMRKLTSSSIDKREALYLLENRLIEKANLFERIREKPSPGCHRYAIYLAHKTCVDTEAATLIFLGRYNPDPAERIKVLREAAGSPEFGTLLPEGGIERIEDSHFALENLQGMLAADANSFRDVWNALEPFLLSMWHRLGTHILEIGEGGGWDALILSRCCLGAPIRNLRQVAVLARRRGMGQIRSLFTAALYRRLSPVAALRLSGLVEAVLRNSGEAGGMDMLEHVYLPYIDRITRTFGCEEGEIFERARALFREFN